MAIADVRAAPRDGALGLDDQALGELSRLFEVVQAEPGQPLLKEGQEAEYLYLIRSGDVEVYRRIRGRRIALEILRPGDLLGRISRADGAPSGFGARALSPVTAIRIRGEALRWLLKTRPALAERFVEYLAGRLERMRRRVEELAGGDLRTRTAALLYDETRGSRASIRLPQSTFAELLGTSRSSLNRVLKDFETHGLVRVTYRRVEVLDPERVRLASL